MSRQLQRRPTATSVNLNVLPEFVVSGSADLASILTACHSVAGGDRSIAVVSPAFMMDCRQSFAQPTTPCMNGLLASHA